MITDNAQFKWTAWDGFRLSDKPQTSRWYSSDNKANHLQGIRDKKPYTYTENDFYYEFNSWGYRCEEFVDVGNPKLLFVGCSNTLGVGIPLETTWSWLFTKKIEAALGRPVTYWNIAHGGKSIPYCTRTLFLSKDILKPDFVIAYFPDGARVELMKSRSRIRDIIPSLLHKLDDDLIPGILEFMTPEQTNYRFAEGCAMLHSMFPEDKLAWNSWALHLTGVDFHEYSRGRFANTKFEADITHSLDRARDALHPGPEANRLMAEALFAEISDKVLRALEQGTI